MKKSSTVIKKAISMLGRREAELASVKGELVDQLLEVKAYSRALKRGHLTELGEISHTEMLAIHSNQVHTLQVEVVELNTKIGKTRAWLSKNDSE